MEIIISLSWLDQKNQIHFWFRQEKCWWSAFTRKKKITWLIWFYVKWITYLNCHGNNSANKRTNSITYLEKSLVQRIKTLYLLDTYWSLPNQLPIRHFQSCRDIRNSDVRRILIKATRSWDAHFDPLMLEELKRGISIFLLTKRGGQGQVYPLLRY